MRVAPPHCARSGGQEGHRLTASPSGQSSKRKAPLVRGFRWPKRCATHGRDAIQVTERRRSRTDPAWGCQTSPVLQVCGLGCIWLRVRPSRPLECVEVQSGALRSVQIRYKFAAVRLTPRATTRLPSAAGRNDGPPRLASFRTSRPPPGPPLCQLRSAGVQRVAPTARRSRLRRAARA